MERPITYRQHINNQLPKQYTYSDLTEDEKKMADFINPQCQIALQNAREVEKLIKRDSNGLIIISDPKDRQIQLLMEHMAKMTEQLNALTLQLALRA
jgi:GAF domain-containing protein